MSYVLMLLLHVAGELVGLRVRHLAVTVRTDEAQVLPRRLEGVVRRQLIISSLKLLVGRLQHRQRARFVQHRLRFLLRRAGL